MINLINNQKTMISFLIICASFRSLSKLFPYGLSDFAAYFNFFNSSINTASISYIFLVLTDKSFILK